MREKDEGEGEGREIADEALHLHGNTVRRHKTSGGAGSSQQTKREESRRPADRPVGRLVGTLNVINAFLLLSGHFPREFITLSRVRVETARDKFPRSARGICEIKIRCLVNSLDTQRSLV